VCGREVVAIEAMQRRLSSRGTKSGVAAPPCAKKSKGRWKAFWILDLHAGDLVLSLSRSTDHRDGKRRTGDDPLVVLVWKVACKFVLQGAEKVAASMSSWQRRESFRIPLDVAVPFLQ
jgi:hypothetical protein